jgi:uncharacterized Tic20 family protein
MIDSVPTSSDRVAAMLTHLGGIVLGFIPALIVYLAVSDNPWLKENARNALNFQLTMLIAEVVSAALVVLLVGVFMLWAIGILVLVLSIVAAVKANGGEAYRYPATIEMIK